MVWGFFIFLCKQHALTIVDISAILNLTNGFIKKTQKTPASEIALAKQYRADYLARKENSK